MHSNLPHFSETYDYHSYKQQATRLGNASETDPASPATAALPLAEIIAIAPYARDAEYAVLTPRDQSVLEKITVNDKIGDIGSQGSDNHGIHGEDRVFMAGNQVDHVAEAVNYDLEFGMNGYILMTESEHASGLRVGHGYGYPKERIIPDIVNPKYIEVRSKHQEMTDDEFNAYFDELRKQARVEQAENIKQLQAESRNDPKYAGRVVMPLRRGVLEYEPEAKTEGARDRRTYRFKHIVQHAPLS